MCYLAVLRIGPRSLLQSPQRLPDLTHPPCGQLWGTCWETATCVHGVQAVPPVCAGLAAVRLLHCPWELLRVLVLALLSHASRQLQAHVLYLKMMRSRQCLPDEKSLAWALAWLQALQLVEGVLTEAVSAC